MKRAAMCLSLNSFCHIQEPKLQARLNLFLGDSNIEDGSQRAEAEAADLHTIEFRSRNSDLLG